MTGPKQTGEIGKALRAKIVSLPSGHALMSEVPDALLAAVREALEVENA
jgi:hypothetical protein